MVSQLCSQHFTLAVFVNSCNNGGHKHMCFMDILWFCLPSPITVFLWVTEYPSHCSLALGKVFCPLLVRSGTHDASSANQMLFASHLNIKWRSLNLMMLSKETFLYIHYLDPEAAWILPFLWHLEIPYISKKKKKKRPFLGKKKISQN